MAKVVKEVNGVDMNEPGILDAKNNAKLNGINNASFTAGKAEDVLLKILKQYSKFSNIVGIVDPPRAGLHSDAIKAIRTCQPLKRLIYVSCNQDALISNAENLCRVRSNNYKGEPFRPVHAAAVDLFPSTAHYELVMLFERENINQPAQVVITKDKEEVTKEREATEIN